MLFRSVSQSRYMFGYGSFIGTGNSKKKEITNQYLGLDTASLSDGQNPLVYGTSINLNLLPIFAYQKIYFDFYSNSQWEKHLAYAYNVDYWSGTGQITLVTDMIKLRYANYPKDYFMGMLPNSQYGSVAVLPSIDPANNPSRVMSFVTATDPYSSPSTLVNPSGGTTVVTSNNSPSAGRGILLNSDLSALSYRDWETDRKSTRLNSSHRSLSRMPSSA